MAPAYRAKVVEVEKPERRYLDTLATDVRALVKRGTPITKAAETAAASERSHWQLFNDYNARNATAAFSEIEWE